MESLKPVIILGTKVDDISLEDAVEKTASLFLQDGIHQHGQYITTPNPEICLHGVKNDQYRRSVLNRSFLSLPDGFGLKLGAFVLGQRLHHRVTGVDFMIGLLERAAQEGWRVFLFGGQKGIAQHCSFVLSKRYAGLQIVGYDEGDVSHSSTIVEHINKTKPDLVFVALGAPKQETWIAEHVHTMPSVRLAVGVGGAFDFIAGKVKRAPRIFQKLGLEWAWRLYMAPRRARRIYHATLKFLMLVVVWRIRMMCRYRRNVVGLIVKGGCSLVGKTSPSQGEDRLFKSGHPLQILLVERTDEPCHWQLPQGGINKGESKQSAIIREMSEEIGITTRTILQCVKNFHRYRWPREQQLYKGYKGQKQDLFILKFTADEQQIKLDPSELNAFQFVPCDDVLNIVHAVRKEQVKKALSFL